ncbi:hypothetical protein, partial [Rhodoferax sp.]|uniref:hypothetical protein n=1 Tax=Rhodoferax sp. TaxID=50421 RepID=UPI0027237C56
TFGHRKCVFAHVQGRPSANSFDPPDMFKVCSACGTTVDRQDCHKNRYAEYICWRCQSAGVKFVRRRRRHHVVRWALPVVVLGFAAAGLILLSILAGILPVDSSSFFGDEPEEYFDTRVGTSLNVPINARPSESAVQAASSPRHGNP